MKSKSTKVVTWKQLSNVQREEIIKIVKENFKRLEFDFVDNRIFHKGYSGSDADFIEISVEGLFDLVVNVLYNKR